MISDENAAKNLLVCALVNHEGEANTQQELPVRDNGDRSYEFSYCPETDGLCTLSVMLEGENVHGSPFMWKVKPKVQNADQLSVRCQNVDYGVYGTEKYCWKVKVHLLPATRRNFEIGVSCVKEGDEDLGIYYDVEVKRSSWCAKYIGRGGRLQFSRSDNPLASAITSLCNGDVFSVYLNFDTKKLVIYNTRNKQAEVFTDAVEGDKVVPIISPYIFKTMQNPSGLSLDIRG